MENRYLRTNDSGDTEITAEGRQYLQEFVTDTAGNVYSFAGNFSPAIIAAAMARLSRFGGDMRELILKEFSAAGGQEEQLLRRVLTQFGDDSVQQLGTVPLVVERASVLVAKQIEWGRLAAYLEQSTRYIYYDVKRDGSYRYYTPNYLPAALQAKYQKAMDTMFANYSQLVRQMTEYYQRIDTTPADQRDTPWRIAIRGKACDASRGLLPMATTSTIGVVASAQAVDNMIMHLLSQDLPESQGIGRDILREVRKPHGIFFERTDMPGRGAAISDFRRQTRRRLASLAAKLPAGQATGSTVPVRLLDYWPKHELDLLPHMLFSHTTLGFEALAAHLKTWSRAEREAAFALYMGERLNRRHKPGRALEIAHYTFEIESDYACFKDLQRHRMVDAMEWQVLGPQLGYEVPQDIVAAGFENMYRQTVALADELYAAILKAGFPLEAQYATLHIHKMRWKLTMNAREAFHLIELRTQPAGYFGYRKLAQQIHEQLAAVHPRLAKHMIFVNRTDDDPSMSRLAQARAAQAKLKALGLEGLIE